MERELCLSFFLCVLHYCLAQDFIVKGTLNLKCLKFRVLDEADEMLNMGFVDDVELILGMFITFSVSYRFFQLSRFLMLLTFLLKFPSGTTLGGS